MLIVSLLRKNQNELYEYILKKIPNGFSIYKEDGKYLYLVHKESKNKRLPLLISHLDTVDDQTMYFKYKPIEITDTDLGKVTSIENSTVYSCLGGDDRCGVWLMLQLLKSNPKDYKFLFTFDEEIGGKGSNEFVSSKYFNEKFYTCYISLDRRSPNGNNEVATYGYDNNDLISIFNVEGYNTAHGSFTDCMVLSEASSIACVSLSVGYDNEHSTKEVVYLSSMYKTLETLQEPRVINQLQTPFIYENTYSYNRYMFDDWVTEVCCEICGVHSKLYLSHGYMMCSDCVSDDMYFGGVQ